MTSYTPNRVVKHIYVHIYECYVRPSVCLWLLTVYGCNGTGYLGVVRLQAAVVTTKREYKSPFMMRRLELIIDFMSHHRKTVALEVSLSKSR